MSTREICAVLVAVAALAGGCSSGALGTRATPGSQPSQDEVVRLKEHVVELERRAAMVEVEIERLRKRLAELESEAGAAGDGGSISKAAQKASEATSVGAGSDRRARDSGGAPSPEADRAVEVSDLGSEPPSTAARATVAPATAEDSTRDSGDDLSASAQALYDRGYTLFHQQRYVDSETAFQQFLQGYSATVLGDNAQFWIAEARYARGDVGGALAAFRETVSRFPDGNKVPDAQLKVGDCLRDLGDDEGARRSYREVVREHPNSAAAAIAEERLATLR